MSKNKKVTLLSIGALLLTLALGLVAFAPIDTASAAMPEDGFNRGVGPGGFPPGGRGSNPEALAEALGISLEELQAAQESVSNEDLESEGMPHGPGSGSLNQEALAEALGISLEELQAAQETVQSAALEQAVANGSLPEEQVAMISAQKALREYIQKDEMTANALGITVEELEAAREDGQSPTDLMEASGLEMEGFQANMEAQYEAVLEQAVEEGFITQEQADQILEDGFHGMSMRAGRGRSGRGGGMERPDSRGGGAKPGTGFNGSGQTDTPETQG